MRVALYVIAFLFLAYPSHSFANDYFPENVFSDDKNVNDSRVKWYSKHLTALEEDSLWERSQSAGSVVYRFLSLPTWGNPTSITFTIRDDGRGILIVKNTDGQGGYEPGRLVGNQTIILDQARVNEIQDQFKKLNFWSLPAMAGVQGRDGSRWIIEGVEEGRYHLVDRWFPGHGEFYDTCLLLFEAAGLEPK